MLILAYYKAHISTTTFISMSASYKWICIKFYQRWVLPQPGYDQQLRSTCIWIRIWCNKNDIRKIEEMRDQLSFLVILFLSSLRFQISQKNCFEFWESNNAQCENQQFMFSQGPQGGFKTASKNIKNTKVLFILILVISHCVTVVVNWTLPHSCINSP